MKTHRELRPYLKMQRILSLLQPLIDMETENENTETDVVALTHKMQKEQMDMLKVHEERQIQGGTITKASGQSKRK